MFLLALAEIFGGGTPRVTVTLTAEVVRAVEVAREVPADLVISAQPNGEVAAVPWTVLSEALCSAS